MSEDVWVVLGTNDEELLAEAVRLATEIGKTAGDRPRISALLFGDRDGRPAELGADELVVIDTDDGEFRDGAVGVAQRVDALEAVAEERPPTLVLFPSTPDGDLTAARFAGRVGGGCQTNCLLRVRDGELHAGRQTYSERAVAEVSFQSRPIVASLNTDVLDGGRLPEETEPTVVEVPVEPSTPAAVRQHAVVDLPEEDLSRASVVVAGGYGLDGPDGFDVIEELADVVGGTVGASRPPVDDGWVSFDRQIGVTGAEIDADLYVPCAISGDSYHVRSVGAEHLVPINTDPDARIFEYADLGVVGDVYEYGPTLARAIEDATAAEEGDS